MATNKSRSFFFNHTSLLSSVVHKLKSKINNKKDSVPKGRANEPMVLAEGVRECRAEENEVWGRGSADLTGTLLQENPNNFYIINAIALKQHKAVP